MQHRHLQCGLGRTGGRHTVERLEFRSPREKLVSLCLTSNPSVRDAQSPVDSRPNVQAGRGVIPPRPARLPRCSSHRPKAGAEKARPPSLVIARQCHSQGLTHFIKQSQKAALNVPRARVYLEGICGPSFYRRPRSNTGSKNGDTPKTASDH